MAIAVAGVSREDNRVRVRSGVLAAALIMFALDQEKANVS
jgi:hypothetical protein